MNKIIFGIALIVMNISCVRSTGVMNLGPDTFTLTTFAAPAAGGEMESKRLALLEASQHCHMLSRELMVNRINSKSIWGPFRKGGDTEINFQCLDKGDSDLRRPIFQKEPDIVIQDNR